MAPFYGWGSTASRLEPFQEGSYFLPLSSQKLVLRRWKCGRRTNLKKNDYKKNKACKTFQKLTLLTPDM